jgi:hypothetical protein
MMMCKSILQIISVNKKIWRGRQYLFSPIIDVVLAGGVAWAAIPLLFAFFPIMETGTVDGAVIFNVSIIFAVFAYLVNHPHFMASYHILYNGYVEKLREHRTKPYIYWRYLWAGVIAPVVLILYLVYAFISQDMAVFAVGVQIMFFTVGWHYVKQAFGVFVVLSALKKIYYGKGMRRLLLANCWLVWMLSWLGGNVWIPNATASEYDMFGVTYQGLGLFLPPYFMDALKALVIGYGVVVALALVAQSWHLRKWPSLSALAGYSTMYTLLLLSYIHPLWVYITPMLHSAQYLLFVAAYKRGEAALNKEQTHMEHASKGNMKHYIVMMLWLGILTFTAIPQGLDYATQAFANERGLFLPFLYAFTIFINIHHYFIDNVIWRRENTEVGKYLFYQKPVA